MPTKVGSQIVSLKNGQRLQQVLHDIHQMDRIELFPVKNLHEAQYKRGIRGDIRQKNDLFVNAISNVTDLKSKNAIGTCAWRSSLTFDR